MGSAYSCKGKKQNKGRKRDGIEGGKRRERERERETDSVLDQVGCIFIRTL